MRWLAVAATVGLAEGFACGHPAGTATAAREDAPPSHMRVPGEYLVTLAPRAGVEAIADLYGRFGIQRVQELVPGVFLVRLAEDPGPARVEELGRQDARVRAVQPNFAYRGSG